MNFLQRRMLKSMREQLIDLECKAQRSELLIEEHEQDILDQKRQIEGVRIKDKNLNVNTFLTALRYHEIDKEIEKLRRERIRVEMECLQKQVDETLRQMTQSQTDVEKQWTAKRLIRLVCLRQQMEEQIEWPRMSPVFFAFRLINWVRQDELVFLLLVHVLLFLHFVVLEYVLCFLDNIYENSHFVFVYSCNDILWHID